MASAGLDMVSEKTADPHGRGQIASNVLWSWGGQIILVASGFIIPRLLDRSLGQSSLGVWDFCWSLIAHIGLIQAGITGSINRYVARFRSSADYPGLNRSVSSVAAVLQMMGLIVLLLTALSVYAMPALLRDSLQGHLQEARSLVLLLGISLAVQVSASVYGGVLTGYERWDWHNSVYAATYALMFIGMILSLKLGYGLLGLAVTNLVCESAGRMVRMVLAYRVCPTLRISWKEARWKTCCEMAGFGGKMFVFDCAYLVLNQTACLLITAFLGPAQLAQFARPAALIRIVRTFMLKYANVFVPAASSLDSSTNGKEIADLAMSSARYSVLLSTPPLVFLMIFGGPVLDVWMGQEYANSLLIGALAATHLFGIAHAPVYYILVGINKHGGASVVIFISAVVAVVGLYLQLSNFGAGLATAAVVLGIPWMVVNGVFLPAHACRILKIPLRDFYGYVWRDTVLMSVLYVGMLVLIRVAIRSSGAVVLAAGIAGALLILLPFYWRVLDLPLLNRRRNSIMPVNASLDGRRNP